ncbi:MAG: RtcB family protein [Oscillospiraceae bacterium]|jgi:RNA-splicing ligase RtcB|nr:RtcB family protein [Oscillospiraceae bacterium]
MIELQGKYNTAKVFTDSAEQYAIAQVINLLNHEFSAGSKIRLMPDAHPGEGCTIGTTMTITDKVVPNLVGVDIGCGMETVLLRDTRAEMQQLDKAVHNLIPAGRNVRKSIHTYAGEIDLTKLCCAKHVSLDRARLSVGTLGGGNHFIELDRDDDGRLYLVIHTGSRNLGKQVAEFYQKTAADALRKKNGSTDRVLAYAEGALLDDYLHDMAIVQRFADLNRAAIARDIIKEMKFKVDERFSTVHNYIDLDNMLLRKGAISAQAGERVLIPMNMRDGSLICVGKGNPDWNFSAPHGAGRLMSRSDAKQSVTLTQFERAMEGIYSTTVNRSTLDESPFAYKPMDEIVANIADTAEIVRTIKPVYNFKSAE